MHQEKKEEDVKSEEVSPAIKMIGEETDTERKKKKRKRKADKLSDRRTRSQEHHSFED